MSRLVLLASVLLLPACGPGADTWPATPGHASRPAAAPAPRDAEALRAAASRALSEQRVYAPAGDNAIEHYLGLREASPDDASVQLALLELLPYPVIASEQAIAPTGMNQLPVDV